MRGRQHHQANGHHKHQAKTTEAFDDRTPATGRERKHQGRRRAGGKNTSALGKKTNAERPEAAKHCFRPTKVKKEFYFFLIILPFVPVNYNCLARSAPKKKSIDGQKENVLMMIFNTMTAKARKQGVIAAIILPRQMAEKTQPGKKCIQ